MRPHALSITYSRTQHDNSPNVTSFVSFGSVEIRGVLRLKPAPRAGFLALSRNHDEGLPHGSSVLPSVQIQSPEGRRDESLTLGAGMRGKIGKRKVVPSHLEPKP
jgi:hypothetical protein